ncbi:MAG: ribonuclease H family protein [Proteobacteria bacterium]|nr:ribonuclease H family protein [Pseudomonadota bacterium]MBU1542376.1 ribonuclease H family protein [Pseudomonadota bacterium]
MTKSIKKFYVVMVGRVPGIYGSWPECQAQTVGFSNAKFKSFTTFEEAAKEYDKSGYGLLSFHSTHPIIESYCVDGACSGNPGPIEYRCVDTKTGEEIFRQGFEGFGTNNAGEFLAIVQALALFKKNNIQEPIYSDSAIAIEWVKQKRCNTRLRMDGSNVLLLDTIARAETWLKNNIYTNEVLKWETRLWGDIPADFGRK